MGCIPTHAEDAVNILPVLSALLQDEMPETRIIKIK